MLADLAIFPLSGRIYLTPVRRETNMILGLYNPYQCSSARPIFARLKLVQDCLLALGERHFLPMHSDIALNDEASTVRGRSKDQLLGLLIRGY
jgi:hypothetical protein